MAQVIAILISSVIFEFLSSKEICAHSPGCIKTATLVVFRTFLMMSLSLCRYPLLYFSF